MSKADKKGNPWPSLTRIQILIICLQTIALVMKAGQFYWGDNEPDKMVLLVNALIPCFAICAVSALVNLMKFIHDFFKWIDDEDDI